MPSDDDTTTRRHTARWHDDRTKTAEDDGRGRRPGRQHDENGKRPHIVTKRPFLHVVDGRAVSGNPKGAFVSWMSVKLHQFEVAYAIAQSSGCSLVTPSKQHDGTTRCRRVDKSTARLCTRRRPAQTTTPIRSSGNQTAYAHTRVGDGTAKLSDGTPAWVGGAVCFVRGWLLW